MESELFTRADREQLDRLGIPLEEVLRQLEAFRGPKPFLHLERPCTVGDGIRVLSEEEKDSLEEAFSQAAREGRCLKFVPASGAATRMFKVLMKFLHEDPPPAPDEIVQRARDGEEEAALLIRFLENLDQFAFFPDLVSSMQREGMDPLQLARSLSYGKILEHLLTDRGLNYGSLPKGLLKFHSYPEGARTPFEEHLMEAAAYVRDAQGLCRLHFTVSPEHLSSFQALLERVRPDYEERLLVRFQVEFSIQHSSTNTLAVDLQNRPFRLDDGSLLFRPAGHGALLENLNGLQGDIVFIKNIDNVVPDPLKEATFRWKRILGGLLVTLQERIHRILRALHEDKAGEELLREASRLAEDELSRQVPEIPSDSSRWISHLRDALNRPLRVCGVVRNVGEPGGGPFWVRDKDGQLSLQIVESAQVDHQDPGQEAVWRAATHFNPVDVVCGLRDFRGRPFDLRRYRDPGAVIITRKSKDGRDLKALELPGLWNGAMAHWNTVFVEVPPETFNPVKTVFDLLRPEHRPQ
jgi:hypothetical protein